MYLHDCNQNRELYHLIIVVLSCMCAFFIVLQVVLKPIFDFGKDIRGEGIEDRSDWDVVDIFSDEAR